ncbi:hypothetical protein [Bdellovibrio reynosensis]|uniref:Uncharacterized protein n=1 Tax=Bdellovibrio reynosensis TaxID=2835041 RepID=A0ABY4CAP4_9BACT|nr:hypothetical protein [Bdellovibrio reynosensis]UOF00962.1 hypothetical protein MNR06_14770 [Bdellovibrio reynosensis]
MMVQNQKGFALALMTAFLPILLAGFFVVFAISGFINKDLSVKHECRKGGLEGQRAVGKILTSLLKLNSKARKLKRDLVTAQERLAAAIKVQNYPVIATSLAKISKLEIARSELDAKQRQLIREGDQLLKTSHAKTKANIQTSLPLESILFATREVSVQGKASELAVVADYVDIAPTYSPVPGFSEKQALQHQWSYSLSLKKPYSSFVHGKFKFKKACAVSLESEGSTWVPQIVQGSLSQNELW